MTPSSPSTYPWYVMAHEVTEGMYVMDGAPSKLRGASAGIRKVLRRLDEVEVGNVATHV